MCKGSKNDDYGGILEFGTVVVRAANGYIATLLGVSLGASIPVFIIFNLKDRCFSDKVNPESRQ